MITSPAGSRGITLLAATVTLLAACSSAPEKKAGPTASEEPTAASFDDALSAVQDRVDAYDGFATGMIALVRVGDETGVVTNGLSDVARDVAMGEDQTFPIASITKPMVATAIVRLVQAGRVSLDDPASTWLPELRGIEQVITVEDLLSHRSGLRDSRDADIRKHGFDTHDLLVAAAAHPLEFEPGTKGRYANIGFGALGLILEKVHGKPLGEVLEEQVFEPAGMDRSELQGKPEVHGYDEQEDVNDMLYLDLTPAAGSVVSTAADVDAFFGALWSGDLLDEAGVSEMRSLRGGVEMGWSDYGLGVATRSTTCGTAYGHGGRINGFTTEAWTLEDGERSTVVMINDFLSDEIAEGLLVTALCG